MEKMAPNRQESSPRLLVHSGKMRHQWTLPYNRPQIELKRYNSSKKHKLKLISHKSIHSQPMKKTTNITLKSLNKFQTQTKPSP